MAIAMAWCLQPNGQLLLLVLLCRASRLRGALRLLSGPARLA